MNKFPFCLTLNNFSVGIADDVIRPNAQDLPIKQRLDSHLPYSVDCSCILTGDKHDELMQFYQDNKTAYILVSMTLEDSKMREYRCLFVTAPTVKCLSSYHNKEWSKDNIINGNSDTSQAIYQTDFKLVAYIPHREKQDEQVIKSYLETSQDSFTGYKILD